MDDKEKIAMLRNALGVLLGDMDFRAGMCGMTEAVGAVVNPITFKICDEAMEATKP